LKIVEYTPESMEKRTIDYITVAGLAIFVILGIVYLCRDYISSIRLNLSPDPSSANIALPAFSMPDLSLGWFYAMDPASKLIFSFVIFLLLSTLVGGALMYLRYRRSSARR
jgi:hypothetical protein